MKFYNNQPRVEKVIPIFQNILIFWQVLVSRPENSLNFMSAGPSTYSEEAKQKKKERKDGRKLKNVRKI